MLIPSPWKAQPLNSFWNGLSLPLPDPLSLVSCLSFVSLFPKEAQTCKWVLSPPQGLSFQTHAGESLPQRAICLRGNYVLSAAGMKQLQSVGVLNNFISLCFNNNEETEAQMPYRLAQGFKDNKAWSRDSNTNL